MGTGVFWNGISFIAEHQFDFTQSRTLILYVAMGLVYTFGAFTSGRLVRRLSPFLAPRTLLAIVIAAQAILCSLPVLVEKEWLLWCVSLLVNYAASLLWPLVESYLTAGRHGPAMRSAIGWFNFVWTIAVTLAMLLMAFVLEDSATWAIGGVSLSMTLALLPLCRFSAKPLAHDQTEAGSSRTPVYGHLLRCAQVLLPMSYVLAATINPILPYRLGELGVDVSQKPIYASTWMCARVVALVIMWRLRFWHGRWGTLLFGGSTFTIGFCLIVLAPTLNLVVLGFLSYGVGAGVIYYAALYYALSIGHAEVDAGGRHEGLIGAGYTLGPLAALLAPGGPVGIVAVVLGMLFLGSLRAAAPYRDWCRQARDS